MDGGAQKFRYGSQWILASLVSLLAAGGATAGSIYYLSYDKTSEAAFVGVVGTVFLVGCVWNTLSASMCRAELYPDRLIIRKISGVLVIPNEEMITVDSVLAAGSSGAVMNEGKFRSRYYLHTRHLGKVKLDSSYADFEVLLSELERRAAVKFDPPSDDADDS